MKVSELTLPLIAQHLNEVEESLPENDKNLINVMKTAAVKFCADYTGLSEEELDNFEDITVVVLALISDMYDNRQTTVDRGNVNRIVDTILGMHSINLL